MKQTSDQLLQMSAPRIHRGFLESVVQPLFHYVLFMLLFILAVLMSPLGLATSYDLAKSYGLTSEKPTPQKSQVTGKKSKQHAKYKPESKPKPAAPYKTAKLAQESSGRP